MQSQEFVSYFEDNGEGLLEMTSTTKQFIVPVGSTVKLRVRMGSKFAQNPILLVNLPQKREIEEETKQLRVDTTADSPDKGRGDALTLQIKNAWAESGFEPSAMIQKNTIAPKYTMTQPFNQDGTRQQMGTGWDLSTTYLKRVLPNSLTNGQQRPSAQTYYEFTVNFLNSGSFFVQLEYGPRQLAQSASIEMIDIFKFTKPSYINVEPVICLERVSSASTLKCKELSICTVVSRCLGQIRRWTDVLQPISEQGFNAVHFTPIQQYGESFSHYSIADQTDISDFFFESGNSGLPTLNSDNSPAQASPASSTQSSGFTKQEKFQQVQQVMDSVRSGLGMFGIVDIVLNHTAGNSSWIQEHPEACYNTDEVPRLWPAYLLDAELVEMTNEFSRGSVRWCPSAPYLNNENDLSQVIAEMAKRARALKLHEFFLCDFDRNKFLSALPGLSSAYVKAKIQEFTALKLFSQDPLVVLRNHFTEKLAHGPERRQVTLKQPDAAIFFVHLNQHNVSLAIEQVQGLVLQLNEYWKTKVTGWVEQAMVNCQGNMRYFKLQLKRNLISKKNYLLDPYFSTLNNSARSKVVHNGWIADHNPLVDFAEEKDFPYLRRQVNIWGDSIKLRYGNCPADSPYLWAHMSEYVTQMATLFDGFRLDNAHSTPIHVCYYMLQVARSHNSNLLVMAELFTSSAELDALFTTRLNINGMIREMMNKGDVSSIGAYFHEITCQEAVVGRLDQDFEFVHSQAEDGSAKNYRLLTPKKPSDVIYDCTHDNPSPLEKFGSRRVALPTIGLLGLADQIIATTWGYDQLLPENISVVKEDRLYPIESSPKEAWGEQEYTLELQVQPIEYYFRFSSSSNCNSVSVAGEFNGWRPELIMVRSPNSNNWQVSFLVNQSMQGRRVQFKFVENGSNWVLNHNLPKMPDGNGNENNYFLLGDPRGQFDTQQQIKKMKDLRVARMLINRAHKECTENDAEIFMHSQTNDTIVVVRQLAPDFSDQYDAYVTVSRFCFKGCKEAPISTTVQLPGFLSEVVFAAYVIDEYQLPTGVAYKSTEPLVTSPSANVQMHNSLQNFARVIDGTLGSRLEFFNLPQAFTCLLKTRCQQQIKQAVKNLDFLWKNSSRQIAAQISPSLGRLTLAELNHILFRCNSEERDISLNLRGPYALPDKGQFVYAGLQSPMHYFQKLKISGDLGDSLLENIRQGDWLMEYCQARVAAYLPQMPRLQEVHDLMAQAFSEVKKLPPSLKPKYLCRVVEKLFNSALSLLIQNQMDPQVAFYRTPDPFLQQMTLACAQMWAKVPSMQFRNFENSLCAGLPHFSTGYMRCWGRDTFISLRGLFLTTGLYKEAKQTILFFAGVERHGLIPNLHDQGNSTRFNARDATWFFLQAIKDYIEMADDGLSILGETFEAEFESRRILTIEQLIMKILQAHANGINFREFNAGPRIDEQMKDEGFNIKIQTDFASTGFCFGGNSNNCGTWMDKMGSAIKNKGVPATPRDGAPIELIGLQYSVLSFLAKMNTEGKFHQEGVEQITFQAWADQIKANFNRCFYIPLEHQAQGYDLESRFIKRRGIYKDTYKSSHGFTDYQLRPNICIAMAVAPQLFDPEQARLCLMIIEELLMKEGSMGIKTLDPSDIHYRGDYNNDDDTRGHNYHQGPEWVWPVGFFLISKLNFCSYTSQREAAQDIVRHLLPHQEHILRNDPWHSLPELTNSNGKLCRHSCTAQAWSIATLLDALHQLGKFKPLPIN